MNEEASPIGSSIHDCQGGSINAGDLARFVIGQLQSDEFIQRAPFVWNK